jgi:hypothetical protein
MPSRNPPVKQPARQRDYNPPLCLTIHGIRTTGKWQKEFQSIVGRFSRTDSFDYGWYGLPRFLAPGFNDRLIDKFYDWLSEVLNSNRDVVDQIDGNRPRCDKKPSIAAHSLGTWILGYAMQKYDDVCFDKIILAGSILPRDFDWELLFSRNQVSRVRNECGSKDPWPSLAGRLIKHAGTGGAEGFDCFAPGLENVPYEFQHSTALLRRHIEIRWVPFLRAQPSPLALLHGREIAKNSLFMKILGHTGSVIDKEAYAKLPNFIEPTDELAERWIGINPDIYTFLIDSRSKVPAGYVNAMPVGDDAYAKIRAGELMDHEIQESAVRLFQANTPLKIYLMSMAISKDTRNWGQGVLQSSYMQLLKGFLDKLTWYAKNERVHVTHFLATAWTPEGRRMCEQFSMSEIGPNKYGYPIFELDLRQIELNPAMPALKRLLDTYRKLGLRK